MKPSTLFALATVSLAVLPLTAACTDGEGSAPGRNTGATVPIAKVTGPAQTCIPINHIRETRIRDDSTIDFIGTGRNETWRVSLGSACPQLKSQNKFTYETSLSQLCSTDIIYVLQDFGGQLTRGAGCGLAPFMPVALAK